MGSAAGAPTRTLLHFEAGGPAVGVDAEPEVCGSAWDRELGLRARGWVASG